MLYALTLQGLSNLIAHHSNGNLILDTSRDNEICYFSLWGDIFVIVGLDKGEPLLDATFDVAASFLDVSHKTARETQIGISLCEDFEVQEIDYPWVMQGKYAFENYDVRGVDCCSLGEAGVLLERVDWDLCDLAILNVF